MPIFTTSELIKVAVKDEETGIAFYKSLAEITKNPEIREKMLDISKQESHHAERFAKMLDEIGEYKPHEAFPGEYKEYLRALLESRAFPEPAQAAEEAKKVKSDIEAIAIAERLEKDTLIFLNEMREFIPETHSAYLDDIIKEERNHLKELAQLRSKLSK